MALQSLAPMTLFVGIKNNVSGTSLEDPMLKPKRHYSTVAHPLTETAKMSPPVQIIEFLGNGMVLEIPSRSCAVGHDLLVTIKTSGTAQDTEFSSTGKVIECVPLPKDRMQVCLSFLQLDQVSWKRLRDALDQTQRRIDDLLSNMRGY